MKQIIIGCLFRVRDYSIGGREITKGILDYGYEFLMIGYKKQFFKSVLKKFMRMYVEKNKIMAWEKALKKF